MGKKILSVILTLAMLAGTGQVAFADGVSGESPGISDASQEIGVEGKDYEAGSVIVVFKEGTTNSKVGDILDDNDASLETKTRVDGSTVALASIDDDKSVSEAMDELGEESRVEYVQPNYKYALNETDPYLADKNMGTYYYQKQFGMTNAIDAWSEVKSSSNYQSSSYKPAVVCVLDTGADLDHEDLKDNLVSSSAYMQFANGSSKKTADDSGVHGTHVAGIIGAVYNNGKGGAGIASGSGNDLVKVLPVGASGDGESLFTMDIVNGMNYAASQGAKVINMSFGSNEKDRVEGAAIKALYYNKGITFVAAAGNEYTDEYADPSDMKEVISVCNYDVSDGKTVGWNSTGSNYGLAKDISAPGQSILSTWPGNGYRKQSGTSMASPMVSAVCALMIDANPALTPAQIRNIICATAKKDAVIEDNEMGYGTIDAAAAVKAAKNASKSIEVESVELKANRITLEAGEDEGLEIDVDNSTMADRGYGLEALVLPAESLADITWSSDDTDVAEVDENGIIIAKKAGVCHITAEAGGRTDTCTVNVTGGVDPSSVSISSAPSKLAVGEIIDLSGKVKILPSNTTNSEIYWSSSDPSVAFAEGGYIEAKKAGKCTVTAETYNGKKASFTLTVTAVPVSVRFTDGRSWIRYGTSFDFNAELTDSTGKKDLSDGDITWAVSPKNSGTIDASTGKFTPNKTGLSNGYAYIVAYSNAEDSYGDRIWKAKKVTIIKNNYKGKSVYKLKKKKVTKRTVTIKWRKIPAADRYVIQRAKGKKGKFKTIKTVKAKVVLKNKGTLTFKNKKLKKNTVYRYRVKAQYIENGKRKSFGYSNKIKVKTGK